MSDSRPSDYVPPAIRDYWEILRLPVLLAVAAIAATWLVWYFTSATCSPELAEATGCNPAQVAQYINIDALNKMVTHAVIAGGGGGLWSYAMITRERKAREAIEKQLIEERERAEARIAEERARADARIAEERERADARIAEERREFLAVIERITERQNGGNRQAPQ